MYACANVCTCVCLHVCVNAKVSASVILYDFPCYVLMQFLSLNQELTDLANEVSSEPYGFTYLYFYSAGIIVPHHNTQNFVWILGIQTQILMLV